jgi:hypothetical protein
LHYKVTELRRRAQAAARAGRRKPAGKNQWLTMVCLLGYFLELDCIVIGYTLQGKVI